MDKTARTELRRLFLIEALPEPLTRASAHLQIFDNYIAETRLRIRSVRIPESREWVHTLQQRSYPDERNLSAAKIAEIGLNEQEHKRMQIFEGDEIRKNRYFHEFEGRGFAFDVYLGKLWGLNTARIEFDTAKDMDEMDVPGFALFDVTSNPFFLGEKLVYKTFADVQEEAAGFGLPRSDPGSPAG